MQQKNVENARREIKTVVKHWPAKDFHQFLREERSKTSWNHTVNLSVCFISFPSSTLE